MRWVAKNVVAAGLAERVEVQVAYVIGKAAPVGLFVETFGTELADPASIEKAIMEVFDLRPAAIVRDLGLLRPIYASTAAYGHFGRTDIDLPWERVDRTAELLQLAIFPGGSRGSREYPPKQDGEHGARPTETRHLKELSVDLSQRDVDRLLLRLDTTGDSALSDDELARTFRESVARASEPKRDRRADPTKPGDRRGRCLSARINS